MALLFMDGFDHYATADILKKWDSSGGSPSVGAVGRRSTNGMTFNGSTTVPSVTKNLTAGASFVVGFMLRPTAIGGTSERVIAAFLDAGSQQCEIRIGPSGTLSVTRNGTAVTGGTSTNALTLSTEHYLEWKVTIANSISAGSCVVRINGVDWITVETGQDIQATANATANAFRLGGNASNCSFQCDDLYIASGTSFLGDVRVDTLLPNGAGNYQSWTPSTGTDHAALVDEATPNTTDYLSGGAAGTKETLALGSTGSSGSVLGVQVCNAVAKSDAGTSTIKNLIRSGSTDANGANFSPSTSYLYSLSVHETDPATSAAWTVSAINALEAGAEVVA